MKMTNREIIGILNALSAMAEREKAAIKAEPAFKRMPIKAVYKIQTNKKVFRERITPYEESLKELVDRYGVKMEATGLNVENLESDKLTEFNRELTELLELEVDVEISKIHIEAFGDYEISQEDMEVLEFMLM